TKKGAVSAKEIAKHVAIVCTHIRRRSALWVKLRRSGLRDHLKRDVASAKFQEKVQKAGLAALGIEWTELERRRKIDGQLATRELDRQKAQIREYAKSTWKEQRRRIRELQNY